MMSHYPTHRRKLAAPSDPQISKPTMDPTGKSRPKSITTTSSTVYNLTNHFSRLQPNQKPTKSHKQLLQTHSQVKVLSKSAILESTSNPSSGQKIGKRVVLESDKKELKKVEGKSNKEEINEVIKPTTMSGIGKRRSFCDVQVELANFLLTNGAKVVTVDMPPFMQIHAVNSARKTKDSLEKFTSKSLALSLKKEFDGVYGPAWHCIVGSSFGSFVTHSVGGFLYFSLDQKLYILLFKTAVQIAQQS